jgi:hypothetical protein
MKKLFTIITLLALALPAFAQFVPGPRVQSALSIPSGGYVLSSVTEDAGTNVANAIPFRINGASPILLFLSWGCTNATTGVSNTVFNFQISPDGVNWIGPGGKWLDGVVADKFPRLNLIQPAGGQTVVTNFTGTTDLSSFNWIKLYSVSNINIGAADNTIYLTNIAFIQGTK